MLLGNWNARYVRHNANHRSINQRASSDTRYLIGPFLKKSIQIGKEETMRGEGGLEDKRSVRRGD